MLESTLVTCPYCWQSIEIIIDTSALPAALVEDCSVCCQPIVLRAELDARGELTVDATREND